MSDISDVYYRLALMRESMDVSKEFLLIRLHLKQVTIAERAELKARAAFVQQRIKELNL